MGWQDRDYSRESRGASWWHWLIDGRLPLFTVARVRVQANSWLVIAVILILLFGMGGGTVWQDRVIGATALFVIILLHEFGHVFTCRAVGGEADEIVMHPLGGLALASPPRRPLPTFLTVAGGPAVNVALCVLAAATMYVAIGSVPWKPFAVSPATLFTGWASVAGYAYWVYQMSLMLLLFNLLPIYPLDGGQILQTALWPKFGYHKSMLFSTTVGLVAGIFAAGVAIATFSLNLALLGVLGAMYCYQQRQYLLYSGSSEFADEDGPDLSAVRWREPRSNPRQREKQRRTLERERVAAAQQRQRLDSILAKLSAHGRDSLTWAERRTLKQATAEMRRRDERSNAC